MANTCAFPVFLVKQLWTCISQLSKPYYSYAFSLISENSHFWTLPEPFVAHVFLRITSFLRGWRMRRCVGQLSTAMKTPETKTLKEVYFGSRLRRSISRTHDEEHEVAWRLVTLWQPQRRERITEVQSPHFPFKAKLLVTQLPQPHVAAHLSAGISRGRLRFKS